MGFTNQHFTGGHRLVGSSTMFLLCPFKGSIGWDVFLATDFQQPTCGKRVPQLVHNFNAVTSEIGMTRTSYMQNIAKHTIWL